MYHLYKQNKKLFLSLCTSFFAGEIPSSVPQEKPDELDALTLSLLSERKKLASKEMRDIMVFITSIEADKKAGRNINQERIKQIQNLKEYIRQVKELKIKNDDADARYLESKL
jgi:hypothetical protein